MASFEADQSTLAATERTLAVAERTLAATECMLRPDMHMVDAVQAGYYE